MSDKVEIKRIESLTTHFEMPREIANTFETEIDGQEVIFGGRVFALQFVSGTLKGNAEIWRRDRKFEERDELVWSAKARPFDNWTSFLIGEKGETAPERARWLGPKTCPSGVSYYREDLVFSVANKGVLVTNDLLDKIFDPVDSQLKEIWSTVARFTRSGSK